jgi:hypothetical protein
MRFIVILERCNHHLISFLKFVFYLNVTQIVLGKVVSSSDSVSVGVGGNSGHDTQNSVNLLVSDLDSLKGYVYSRDFTS